MTITNGYCTLQQLQDEIGGTAAGSSATDTTVMEQIIEDASRAIDNYCGGRHFFSSAETHYADYPVPYDAAIWLDDDLIAVGTLTNGDGASVASTAFTLWPKNALAHAAILANSGTTWAASGADTYGIISVAGSWGYVDRSASGAAAVRVIDNTRRACLIIAAAYYRKRFGVNVEAATVTRAGVVLTPQGIPKDAAQLLDGYVRRYA